MTMNVSSEFATKSWDLADIVSQMYPSLISWVGDHPPLAFLFCVRWLGRGRLSLVCPGGHVGMCRPSYSESLTVYVVYKPNHIRRQERRPRLSTRGPGRKRYIAMDDGDENAENEDKDEEEEDDWQEKEKNASMDKDGPVLLTISNGEAIDLEPPEVDRPRR